MRRSLVLLCALASASSLASVIQSIEVDVTGDTDRPRVLELLGLAEGETFSEAALERGLIRVTEGAGRFQSVRGTFDDETGIVRVELRSALRLTGVDVRLSGVGSEIDETLREDLLQASGLSNGDPVSPDMLTDVRERLAVRLSERGFLSAEIVLALEDKGAAGQRTLLASIAAGIRSRVTKLSLRGFSPQDTQRLIGKIVPRSQIAQIVDQLPLPKLAPVNVSEAVSVDIPLDWIALNESLNRWAQQERQRGYYDFRISLQVLEGKEEVTIGMTLDRGPRYDVQVRGNVLFWERELRSKVVDRSLRLGVPFSTSDAENILKRLYQAAGYKDIRVSAEFRDEEGLRKVAIHVEEGRHYVLGQLSFDGGAASDPIALSKVLESWRQNFQNPLEKTPFDEKFLQAQLPDLLRRVRALGYLQARILEIRPRVTDSSPLVPVEIAVQLGFRAKLRSVSVTGNLVLTSEELDELIDLRVGEAVNPDRLNEINRALLLRYQELGFLDARVETDEKKMLRSADEGPDVDLELHVEPGAQTRAGKPLVIGNVKTKQKVILRELDRDALGEGSLWTPSAQLGLEQRLLGLGVFGGAEVRPTGGRRLTRANAKDGVIEVQEKDVRISVNERPGGSIEFGPGFRSDRGVIGFAEMNYRNLGGWNRGVLARAEVSRKVVNYQFPEQKYSFAYLEPYLMNLRLRLRFGIDYQRRDQITFVDGRAKDGFNSEETTFSFLLERQLLERLKLVYNFYTLSLANYTSIVKNYSSVDSSAATGLDPTSTFGLNDYQIGSTGPTFTFDSRDNPFNPTSGWISNSSLELSAPQLGSRTNAHYLVARQAMTRYIRLFNRSSLAVLGSYSRIHALGQTSNLPEGKRFYIGGASSLRSFSQNAIGYVDEGVLDQQAIEFKVEYRQPIILELGLALFFDAGQIDVLSTSNDAAAVAGGALGRASTGLRKATGFGLRYTSPIGALAFDFAYNLDRRPTEPNEFKIQFSIGSF